MQFHKQQRVIKQWICVKLLNSVVPYLIVFFSIFCRPYAGLNSLRVQRKTFRYLIVVDWEPPKRMTVKWPCIPFTQTHLTPLSTVWEEEIISSGKTLHICCMIFSFVSVEIVSNLPLCKFSSRQFSKSAYPELCG